MPKRTSSIRLKKATNKIGLFFLIGFMIGALGGYEYAMTLVPTRFSAALEANQVEIRFSPGGKCLQLVEEAINRAQKQILVQAYAFTASTLVEALIAAHQRGVSVRILVDRSQLTSKGSKVKRVQSCGLHIAIDQVPGIAHNKVILIDDDYVLTGSFNWSHAAEYKNAENLLLIHNKEINRIYRKNWEKRAEKAIPLEGLATQAR